MGSGLGSLAWGPWSGGPDLGALAAQTDRQNIPCILQDIVPLGPLPKKEEKTKKPRKEKEQGHDQRHQRCHSFFKSLNNLSQIGTKMGNGRKDIGRLGNMLHRGRSQLENERMNNTGETNGKHGRKKEKRKRRQVEVYDASQRGTQ